MLNGLNWTDILDRAEWTFAQAFLTVAGAAGTGLIDMRVWKSAALSGAAAVLSLLKNTVFQIRAAKAAPVK